MDDFSPEIPDTIEIPDIPEISDVSEVSETFEPGSMNFSETEEVPDSSDFSQVESSSDLEPENTDSLPGVETSGGMEGSGQDSGAADPGGRSEVAEGQAEQNQANVSGDDVSENSSSDVDQDTLQSDKEAGDHQKEDGKDGREAQPDMRTPEDEMRPEDLQPNSTYERNGYEYTIDENGRTERVFGDLSNITGERTPLQTEIGHMGVEGDEGGHLIGARFNGPTDAFNLVPQNADLNRGEWKNMESGWAAALGNGSDVKVLIEPNYASGSSRPDSFEVVSQIDGELTYYSYLNQSSKDKGDA